MSRAWLISWATAGLASNVCGSVFGLLMIAEACTYFPPTCEMTSAYSFSAPIATMAVEEAAAADDDVPAALDEADDEQALARSTAARGTAVARRLGRIRMTLVLQLGEPQGGLVANE